MVIFFCLQRNIITNTGNQNKFKTNLQKKSVFFSDAITNLYKRLCVLSSTLCTAWEWWISCFLWHQNIMITQYLPRAMSFILTWQNLITLISHCLLYIQLFTTFSATNSIGYYKNTILSLFSGLSLPRLIKHILLFLEHKPYLHDCAKCIVQWSLYIYLANHNLFCN